MSKLLITTQYRENYGSEESPFWKSKGSYDYFVLNVTEDMSHSVLVRAREKIEYTNSSSEERIIGYRLEADDYITRDEELQMEYEGKIVYPTPVIEI